jgi:lipoprotein-anchoring transpeptidase ErfK/SrfK
MSSLLALPASTRIGKKRLIAVIGAHHDRYPIFPEPKSSLRVKSESRQESRRNVGREEGFTFRGEAIIARKAEWPRWTPTKDMIAREPERYGPYRNGMPGGEGNPLGPRALYLYKDGRDTLYRLHGTLEPRTIGSMVSSGCIRLLNQDIIDLYDRVPVGTKVIVLPTSYRQARKAPDSRYTA